MQYVTNGKKKGESLKRKQRSERGKAKGKWTEKLKHMQGDIKAKRVRDE
jgi:hypothetical protein